ncbi:MAG: hypothetical protein M1821_000187 [Bathelium mastoideum]|nr:MAG: hypothetical protein M1821_000187 [Bathelium mastoideum]
MNYQSTPVAEEYATLGYLVGILSIIGLPIMPRAKFLQNITLNIIATCFSAAVAILAMWSSVQARIHTTPRVLPGTGGPGTVGTPASGASTGGYNSSQSAVCAVWLFFQIYAINSLKSRFPQLQFAAIIWSIFAVVSMSYAPSYTTTAQALNFVRHLLLAFLTGFGISFGVSLLVFPMTSRKIVFKVIPGYIGAMRGALKAHTKCVETLEYSDMLSPPPRLNGSKAKAKLPENPYTAQSMAFKKAVGAVTMLNAKLSGELPFAKREVAIGKIGPDDLNELLRLLRAVMIPLLGLSSVPDVFEKVSQRMGWDRVPTSGENQKAENTDPAKEEAIHSWNQLARLMHEPIAKLTEVMDEGLHHTLLQLQFVRPSKKSKVQMASGENDVEAKGDAVQPGDPTFGGYMDVKIQEFEATKESILRQWCEIQGIELPPDFFDKNSTSEPFIFASSTDVEEQKRRRQMYLVLYIQLLLTSTGRAILDLVYFADLKARSGKMDRSRLIAPGYNRMRKWLRSIFTSDHEDSSDDLDNAMHDTDSTGTKVYVGSAYQKRKDPEHLPPQGFVETIGDYIRKIPQALRSQHARFGFRVACAVLSIAIAGFIRQSHIFYTKQRVFWAVIMISISMTPTAGQSLWNFSLRIAGTVIAMVCSFIVWYIVDGHRAGVIVFYWLFCTVGFYIPLKLQRYTIVGIISVVTLTLIIGYELQVDKIGIKLSTSNGQPYYPIYTLAPYRLGAVAAGLFVAFIWTIFPFPITEHSQLRRHLGSSLYLLANLYSVVHETMRCRIAGVEGDLDSKESPGRKLEKARLALFTKQTMLLGQMKNVLTFLKWDIPMGGRFPKETYIEILSCVENIQNFTALLSYSTRTFHDIKKSDDTKWMQDFRELLRTSSVTSNEITSLLSLLSLSITTGQPLPPYMKTPTPFALGRKLESMDRDILSLRHLAEPGYAAFAMMQITTHSIITDIEKLLDLVRKLIGEMDFSFHIISTSDDGGEGSSLSSLSQTQVDDKGKQD